MVAFIEVMSSDGLAKAEHIGFTIKYNGESVESHEMDANDLANSLLGLSGALERASYIVNGVNSKTFVKVKGSFKPGSFDVDIVVLLLTSPCVEAVLNAVTLLGFVENSFESTIKLFKKTKGERVEHIKYFDDNKVELSFKNCQNITVNNHVAHIYADNTIRKELEKLVLPLEDEKMSDITFLKNGVEQEKITRDEKSFFDYNDDDVVVNVGTDYFLITQSNFEGRKTGWKLALVDSIDYKHGQKDFSVKIKDNNFLKSVRNKKIIISNEDTIIKAKYKKTIKDVTAISWEIEEVLQCSDNNKRYNTKSTNLYDFQSL